MCWDHVAHRRTGVLLPPSTINKVILNTLKSTKTDMRIIRNSNGFMDLQRLILGLENTGEVLRRDLQLLEVYAYGISYEPTNSFYSISETSKNM